MFCFSSCQRVQAWPAWSSSRTWTARVRDWGSRLGRSRFLVSSLLSLRPSPSSFFCWSGSPSLAVGTARIQVPRPRWRSGFPRRFAPPELSLFAYAVLQVGASSWRVPAGGCPCPGPFRLPARYLYSPPCPRSWAAPLSWETLPWRSLFSVVSVAFLRGVFGSYSSLTPSCR